MRHRVLADEMIGDPHFVERGFPHEIEYETRNASYTILERHTGSPKRRG